MKQKKSFTLIEMLIVVVIIGILAAALIPRLQNVQARARDVKRKADLHQISQALAVYNNDNSTYPKAKVGGGATYDCESAFTDNDFRSICGIASKNDYFYPNTNLSQWIEGLAPAYLTQIPVDPINNLNSTEMYPYRYLSQGAMKANVYTYNKLYNINGYLLSTNLENGNDSQSCQNTAAGSYFLSAQGFPNGFDCKVVPQNYGLIYQFNKMK